MTQHVYRPETKHPEPYQQDLNPDAAKGINWGNVGPHPEKDNPRTAYDAKDVHLALRDFNDEELKRIPIMPVGSRLESKATYIDLKEAQPREFTAEGDEDVGDDEWIVPKKEVDYELWNRLLGPNKDVPPRTPR